MNVETPKLAVDVICYHPLKKEIVLIQRKYPPLGMALPGGFVDVGETVEDAAKREMKEELNLDLSNLRFVGIYSDPARDPRRHVVSIAYVSYFVGTPVAGDDAKSFVMKSVDDVLRNLDQLAFDHAHIIQDAVRQHCF